MRILLADHHILFREGLAGLLSADPQMEVVGSAGTGPETLEQVRALQPDLLLLDLRLPDGQALSTLRAISAAYPQVKTVVLTSLPPAGALLAALESGARGYLPKEIAVDALKAALRGVQRGEPALSPALTAVLLDQLAQRSRASYQSAGFASLTGREAAVLEQICGGGSNHEIAAALGITENTVKAHVRKVLDKLGAPNRRAARRIALEQGFLTRVDRG